MTFRKIFFLKKFTQARDLIIGSSVNFTLQIRILHTFCFIAINLAVLTIFFNFLAKLYYSAIASLAIFIGLLLSFFLSRLKNKSTSGFVLLICTMNIALTFNYFFNAGIKGPTLLLLLATYLGTVMITPNKGYFIITVSNITLVFSLLTIEFLYPSLIKDTYTGAGTYFLDHLITYIVVSMIIATGVTFVIKNYQKEQLAVNEQARVLGMLNDEKAKLISILSHDLRAPLAGIKTYLGNFVNKDISINEREEIERALLDLTNQTSQLLDDILSWSSDYFKAKKVEMHTLDIGLSLAKSKELFQHLADQKQLSLDLQLEPNLEINGNEALIQLILRNLIHNAIKFTSVGGSISLNAYTENTTTALVTISDSGTGTAILLTEDIFNSSGISNLGTQSEQGFGLGLPLCKQYTEAQYGTLKFQQNEHGGATFFLRFPLMNAV